MDLIDLIWNGAQQWQLSDLSAHVDSLRLQQDLKNWDTPKLKELAVENLELRLRLSMLLRLLIAKGVFSAEEFAKALAETRAADQSALRAEKPAAPNAVSPN